MNEKERLNQAIKNITLNIEKLNLIKTLHFQIKLGQSSLEKEFKFEVGLENLFDFSSSKNVLSKLDVTLRYELFVLATHYWEVAWLLESEHLNNLSYDKAGRQKYWQIQAMLTPCFITTLHSGPSFFQYKAASQEFETLSDFVDLLIIDEAGQAMSSVAGGMVSTAKRLLLVGDAKQIEPIFSLTESIDLANAKKFGVCENEEDYEALRSMGVLCSGCSQTQSAYGNLIVLGQRKSKFHLEGQELPGLLLKEHRRCAKEIIRYCNELCYNNQLIVLTDEKSSPFPRMGYAHVKGIEEKKGSSRFNQQEAFVIANWLMKNKERILTACASESLDECVGIVTPFAEQGRVIKRALSKCGLQVEKAGTVHSLQGAEKPIILFSSVYSSKEQAEFFFFDRSPNMLNVAVSRAKMSFLVFGDMDIFDVRQARKPSSMLARHLFEKEENEIVDIIQPTFHWGFHEEIDQVNTLEKHRKVLKRSFSQAQSELNIVSPFLRLKAIEADDILDLLKKFTSEIEVNIYSDPTLNQKDLETYKTFLLAKEQLESAGARVILVNKVHSKIIAIDQHTLIQGSFNWLSSSRDIQYSREESSILYQGKYVARLIQDALDPIRNKAKLDKPVFV